MQGCLATKGFLLLFFGRRRQTLRQGALERGRGKWAGRWPWKVNGPWAVESERAVGRGKWAGRGPWKVSGPLAVESERAVGRYIFFVDVSVHGLVHGLVDGLVDGLVHGLVHGLVDQWSDRKMAKIQPFINNFLIAVKFPETKGSYMLLHRSDLNISEIFRQTFSHFFFFFGKNCKNSWFLNSFQWFLTKFDQVLMKFCRNFADNLEHVEIFWNFWIF